MRDRPLREWFEAANAANWQTVLASTEKWLDACPVDIDAHFFRTVALFETGRPADGAAHKAWHQGLVDSVVRSGDGRSYASPYVVISIPEEYAVLRSLRLKRQSQSLLDGGIDAIEVTDESGISSTVYFRLVDAYWRRMDELLEKARRRK